MWSSAGPIDASVWRTVSSVESFSRIAMPTIGAEVAAAIRAGMPSRASGPASFRKAHLIGLVALQRPPDDGAWHLLEHLLAPALGLLDRGAALRVGGEQRRIRLQRLELA